MNDQTVNYEELIKLYREGNISLKKFCNEHNVPLSAMNYHLYQRKKSNNQSSQLVKLNVNHKEISSYSNSTVLRYKGIKIDVNENNLNLVTELIKRLTS